MDQETIKRFIEEAHGNAVDKGFYDCPECGGSGKDMDSFLDKPTKTWVNHNCIKCNGTRIDPDKNIGELLMLIVSALGEALEAHRCGRFADWKWIEPQYRNDDKMHDGIGSLSWLGCYAAGIKDTFEDEIADVFIRLFDLCGYLEIEPEIKPVYSPFKDSNIGEMLLKVTGSVYNSYNSKKNIMNLDIPLGIAFDICRRLKIDIQKHIEAKMAYNKTRPHKHNKEY